MTTEQKAGLDQAAFTAAMEQYFGGVEGRVGVMVRDLRTGCEWHHHSTEMYPTASTMKVPVLYELYRQAELGMVHLADRVTLRAARRVPGSGVLQMMDEGLQPTVRDLAELMITVSDNFATDLLLGIIGRENLAATLRALDLRQTHLPLTIWEMLASMVGLDPARTTYDELRQRVRKGPWDLTGAAYAEDERNDVSSPADMVRLLTLVEEGSGMTAASRTAMLDILKHQNFNTVIPARLPDDQDFEVAHKTGSLRGVRNDVGIVYAPHATYAIGFMSKGLADAAGAVAQMALASRWVWDALAAEAGNGA